MNLYMVYSNHAEWVCYVFAETRNKARARLVGYFGDGNTYVEYRARLVKKDVGGIAEVCDDQCPRLTALGVEYVNDSEEVGSNA